MRAGTRILARMRTLVIGDIHGNLRALRQAFKRSGFDPGVDRLVSLGDVFNGHPYSAECVEMLMGVKDFVWCLGNHDALALSWLRGDWNGKKALGDWKYEDLSTVMFSYGGGEKSKDRKLMEKHLEFASSVCLPYHVDKEGRLYVHAGIDWDYAPAEQPDPEIYYKDRKTYAVLAVLYEAGGFRFPYRDVFIGHTKTINDRPDGTPVRRANLWNLDTGAGTYGKLTIMDADTYEYWQSDWGKEGPAG